MKKLIFLLMILSLLNSFCKAQPSSEDEKNIRLEHRFGVSAKFGGAYDILGGIALDAFISPHVNAEINYLPIPILSNIRYYGAGLNLHPFGGSTSRWSPYLGLFFGYANGTAFISGDKNEYYTANFPLGIQYIRENGLNICVEMGLAWVRTTTENAPFYNDEFYPPPSIKIGYRF